MPQPPDAAPRAQTQGAESGAALAAKLAIELGPLLVFFGVNAAAGIYGATAAFMAVTLIALAAAWLRYHKLPVMLLVSTSATVTVCSPRCFSLMPVNVWTPLSAAVNL